MKDLVLTNCSVDGINVTDERDGKSYTVAKFGSYCYMLSNLRLDSTTDGTNARKLTSADSDITPNATYTEFTMPTETWSFGSQNYYCKPIMALKNGEYYYNWYAAKANPYECADPTTDTNATETNDNLALGSICPKNWTLPTHNDVTAEVLWNDDDNFGSLITSGLFRSGSQSNVGSYGYWWSSIRYSDVSADLMSSNGTSAYRFNNIKDRGLPVWCMRSS